MSTAIGKITGLIDRLINATQENKVDWDKLEYDEFDDPVDVIYYTKLTGSNEERYILYVQNVKGCITLSMYKEGFDETGSYDNTMVGEPIRSTDIMSYVDPKSYSIFGLDKLYDMIKLSIWEKEHERTMCILSDLLDNIDPYKEWRYCN